MRHYRMLDKEWEGWRVLRAESPQVTSSMLILTTLYREEKW